MNIDNYPFLVYVNENKPSEEELIATFQDGKVVYMHDRLKSIMKQIGILIPPKDRKNYENKTIVYLEGDGDCLFERTFREIYYKLYLPKDEFYWQEKFND